jgi:hypothetical protein
VWNGPGMSPGGKHTGRPPAAKPETPPETPALAHQAGSFTGCPCGARAMAATAVTPLTTSVFISNHDCVHELTVSVSWVARFCGWPCR